MARPRPLCSWILAFLLGLLTVCLPKSAQGQPGREAEGVSEIADVELLRAYGAALRAAYANGDSAEISASSFHALEAEIDRRALLTTQQLLQVERGIVFIGMSETQLMASFDGLQTVDVAQFPGGVLRAFSTSPVRVEPARSKTILPLNMYRNLMTDISAAMRANTSTFITCNQRVVFMYVTGALLTADSAPIWGEPKLKSVRNVSSGEGVFLQTNFQEGFWKPENRTERIRPSGRGPRSFDDPHSYHLIAPGQVGSFNQWGGDGKKNAQYRSLQLVIDGTRRVKSRGYASEPAFACAGQRRSMQRRRY